MAMKKVADTRDVRHGAYDPVSKDGLPQPHRSRTERHRTRQSNGARMSEPNRYPDLSQFFPNVCCGRRKALSTRAWVEGKRIKPMAFSIWPASSRPTILSALSWLTMLQPASMHVC
jgi:hypothetical protein